MVVDCTGRQYEQKIVCGGCGTIVQVNVLAPERGHIDNELTGNDRGPFILVPPMHSYTDTGLENGAFLRITSMAPDRIEGVLVALQRTGSVYAYGGWNLPDFGKEVGKIVWLCLACKNSKLHDDQRRYLQPLAA